MRSQSRNISICAAFTAVGMIISYLETFVVIPVNIPGIRLGLANTVTLVALYLLGPVYAISVLAARIVLSAVLFGNLTSFIYSFSGAVTAFVLMIFFKKLGFSVYSVSVTGAVFHNIAQITAAFVLVQSIYVFSYIPVLILAGVIFGLITGYLAALLIRRLGKITSIDEREGKR